MQVGECCKVSANHALAMVLLGIISCVTMGCDAHPDIVPVSGTVTIDGQPLKVGQIRVFADGHRPSIGKINEDGTFVLTCFELGDGAYIGTHSATITAVEEINERSNRWYAPKEYANKVSSGLRVTIDGPTDDLKVELTWAGSKDTGPFVDRH